MNSIGNTYIPIILELHNLQQFVTNPQHEIEQDPAAWSALLPLSPTELLKAINL